MLVTASWGGEAVAVEVDAECRSVDALKRCLEEALPELDVEAVRLEVGGRSVDDEEVLGLSERSVIDISVTQAALAADTLRGEGLPVDFDGFCNAARQGDLRLCKLYLDVGVAWPSRVETPLHIAVRHDWREVLTLLLDAGCDKEAKGYDGDTPLHRAIQARDDAGVVTSARNLEVARLLLDAGCDKDARDQDGNTPLHLAIHVRNSELAQLLLNAGCKKDAKGSNDDTPLHRAIQTRNSELAQLLLDAGCTEDA